MKTFKEFLNEVELLPDIKKTNNRRSLVIGELLGRSIKYVNDDAKRYPLAGGEVVVTKHWPGIGGLIFTFFHGGKARIVLSGSNQQRKILHIGQLAAHESPLKAYLFYAFIIKKLGYTLTTDTQSEGGKRVWEELSKVPGISVHGWDPISKKPINTGKGFEDDDLHAEQTYDLNNDERRIKNIILVAGPSK